MALRFPPWPISWGTGRARRLCLQRAQGACCHRAEIVRVRSSEPAFPVQPWWLSLFSLFGGAAENPASSLAGMGWAQPELSELCTTSFPKSSFPGPAALGYRLDQLSLPCRRIPADMSSTPGEPLSSRTLSSSAQLCVCTVSGEPRLLLRL